MADYLAAEGLIVGRLEASLGAQVRAVFSAADLAGVAEQAQITPAVHVVYDGDRLGDEAGRHRAQQVYQRWLVIVAVRNAKGQATGKGARESAGPIISAVLAALQGWQPSPDHQPLRRIDAPRPVFSPGGFAYFPLAFETRIDTEGLG